jgi:ferric-dicitrate binding protein FerR (iron transport regulator)
MPDDYIHSLARKWLAGSATEEEINILMRWYGKEEENIPVKRIPATRWWMAAAVLLVLGSIGWLYQQTGITPKNTLKVYVPKQQRNRILLPDSSIVWLNADSKLQYQDNGNREVILEGEAFFDVRPDVEKPFVVIAGKSRTTVLGTTFNIKAYNGEPKILITVASGKIQVQDEHQRKTILTANKQVMLTQQSDLAEERTVNAIASNAWIHGRYEINNETFEEIANTLSRKFNITIHFKEDALRKCTFIASFDERDGLPRILELLCKINNSTFRFSDDKKEVYVSGEGCRP